MTLDLRGRLTLDVPEAGRLLFGVGRDASYAAAQRQEIPTIRVGRSLRVPTHAALRQLGWTDDLIARALGVDLHDSDPEDTDGPASGAEPTATIHVLARKSGGPHDAPASAD